MLVFIIHHAMDDQFCYTQLHQMGKLPFLVLTLVDLQKAVAQYDKKCYTLTKCFNGSSHTMAWINKLCIGNMALRSVSPHTIASEWKLAILWPEGGKIAKSCSTIWQELLHPHEVFQWLIIHHGIDQQAPKREFLVDAKPALCFPTK